MKTKLITLLQRIQGWRLWLLIVVISVVFAEVSVAALNQLVRGEVLAASMFIGLIASIFAASTIAAAYIHLFNLLILKEQKAYKVTAHYAESRLSIAIENSQMILWEYDFVRDEFQYDAAMLQLLGITTEAPPQTLQAWIELVHPDDRAAFIERVQAILQTGDPVFDFEYRFTQQAGQWGWVHSRGKVIQRDSAGNPQLAVGSTMNINERKQAEESLLQSEILLRSTLESTDEGILIIAQDNRVLSANKRFKELWRVPQALVDAGQDDLLLAYVLDQLDDPDDFLSLVQRLNESDDEARDTLHLKDGRVFARYTRALFIGNKRGRIWCFKDITEQVHAETALMEREEIFRSIVTQANDGIVLVDVETQGFAEFNDAACAGLGYSREEFAKLSIPDIHAEWKSDAVAKQLRVIMGTGTAEFETLHRCKNGSLRNVRVSSRALSLRNHHYAIAIITDITERKQLEQQLSRRLRHRDVMERITQISLNSASIEELLGRVLDEMLTVFNADRAYFLYPCNPDAPSWSVPMERTRSEWPGAFARGMVLPMTPEAAEVFRELLASTKPLPYGHAASRCIPAAVAKQFSIQSLIQIALRPRVGSTWVMGLHHCAQARVYDEDDLLIFKDIGLRVADALSSMIMLKNLHESEERLRAVTDNAGAVIFMKDTAGRYLHVNRQYEKLFHVSNAAIQGKTDHDIFPRDMADVFVKNDQMVVQLGLPLEVEEQAPHDDGIHTYISVKFPLRNASGEICAVCGIATDITERKRAEAEIVAINSELKQANAHIEEERAHLAERVMERTVQLLYANLAKDSFLATMSHEIRTPLGGLLGMMELISLSRLDNQQREMLQAARDSGKSLLRIVDDILDWSKIEAGKLELAPQVAAIPEIIKGVVSTYSPLASAKGLLLRQQVDDKVSAAHLFDPLRLSQILNNFASNAIKFTEQGTVEISAKRVAQSGGNEEVRFCVRDTGIGINKEQQSRLFQHYEQASADTARMYGGTGLGLAICYRLSELMEGSISVESTPGVGTTFCFTLSMPVASPAAQRDLQLRQAREDSSENTTNITPLVKDGKLVSVLLVDDHPVNRMLLKQQLVQLGLHTENTATGIAALSLWQTGRFDLIITDCHMPEMDGYELTRSIREMEQHAGRQRVPIIAWTANVLAEEEERCRAAGMDDILTKPTELADLRAMLLKWLAKADLPAVEAPPPEVSSIEAAQNKSLADTPIDFSVLKKIATSHAAQAEMLQEFNLHNRSDIAGLKAALKEGDPASVERIAHRIKGASRMVGALELDRICTAIEKAAAQGDLSGAQVVAGTALDAAAGRIEAAISAFIAVQ